MKDRGLRLVDRMILVLTILLSVSTMTIFFIMVLF